jgi:osmotically-inducible protein OsmY
MQDPQVDASDIEVQVSDGTVTLEGTVENRRIKHLAENLCEWIPGVQDVTNHLRVKRHEGGAPSRQS